MAEMISSAVTQEAVQQVISRLKERYEQSSDSKERMERMEMAQIRMEAVLEASLRWSVTSAPLLRWRSKLKRAVQECDHTLRRCRRRLQEEEEERSSLPRRFAHAAISFVSSIIGGGSHDDLGGSSVRRFERLADGASEFLRYVELGGGAPRRIMFFDGALVRHLLQGKGTKNCFVHGEQHLSLVLQPFSLHKRRMEGTVIFLLEDGDAPENNFLLVINIRLSECTDIVGTVVRCLELFTPHLSSTVEVVKTKLTQLPMQDLRWVRDAHALYGCDEHQDNLYTIFSKWVQPNPLCCQQLDHSYSTRKYTASSSSTLSDPNLEAVTQVCFLGHITLPSGNNRQPSAIVDGEARYAQHLKLGCNFWPHALSEDLPPDVDGSAIETINGEATQLDLYANISFEQLGEIILPKAVDCLHGNGARTSYQALWKSKHGRAYLKAEKTTLSRSTTRRDGGAKRRKKLQTWSSGNNEFMSSWIVHAPSQMQDSAVDWIEKQSQLPLPLLWRTTSCIHDCPVRPLSLQDLRLLARKMKSLKALNALKA